MEKQSGTGGLPGISWYSPEGRDLLVSSALISILSLALPLTLMQVFDRILVNQATDTLAWLIFGCLTALLLEAGLRLARSATSGSMAARFEHLAGCQAIGRILGSRLEQFERDNLGTHLDRLTAVGTLRGFYSGQVFQVVFDLPFALLLLFVTWFLGGIMVLIPVVTVAAFGAVVFYCNTRFQAARHQQIGSNDHRASFVIEVLSRVHTVKAVSMEEQLLRRHERLHAEGAAADMQVGHWTSLPTNLGSFFSQVAVFGIIGFGASRVSDGSMTLGTLTACSMLSARVMQPIQSLTGFLLRLSEARIARRRFEEIMALEPEVAEGLEPLPEDIAGGIELQNVSFSYGPGLPPVISGASLKVPPRAMVAIESAPSAGSTSLLYLMMGTLAPQEGVVLIDGYNLARWDHTSLRGRLEYLPQAATLFKGTLIENITMFDPRRYEAALDAAALVGLDVLVSALPMGYETPVNAQSNHLLPSGLIQRVGIARALVVRPRVLLLDKTDAAMDWDSQRVYRWLLEQLRGRCTIVVVTSQSSVLAMADEVYSLAGGRLHQRPKPNPVPPVAAAPSPEG